MTAAQDTDVPTIVTSRVNEYFRRHRSQHRVDPPTHNARYDSLVALMDEIGLAMKFLDDVRRALRAKQTIIDEPHPGGEIILKLEGT